MTMMSRVLLKCLNVTSVIAVIIILLTAVYVASARKALEILPSYQKEVVDLVQGKLNQNIGVESIAGSLEGLVPVITVNTINIKGSNEESLLDISSVQLHVDLLSSVLSGDLRLYYLIVEGIRVDVQRTAENQWRLPLVETLKNNVKPSKNLEKSPFDFFHKHENIIVADAVLVLSGNGLPFKTVKVNKLQLKNIGQKHFLAGDFEIVDKEVLPLEFVIEYIGQPESLDALNVDAYAHISESDLQPWLAAYLPEEFNLISLEGDVQLWGSLVDGRMSALQGEVSFSDVGFKTHWHDQALALDVFQSEFFLEKNDNGRYEFVVQGLKVFNEEISWTETSAFMTVVTGDRGIESTNIFIEKLDVAAIAGFESWIPEKRSDLRAQLSGLSPRGEMSNLSIVVDVEETLDRRVAIGFDFSDLGLNAKGKLPGFSGLSGYLSGTADGGIVQVDSELAVLEVSDFFYEKVSLGALNLPFVWAASEDAIRIDSGYTFIGNEDAQFHGVFSADVFKDKSVPNLHLVSTVRDMDMSRLTAYAPMKRFSEGVRKWLSGAVVKGRLISGDLVYEGPAKIAKNDQLARTHQMYFAMSGSEINFLEGWPLLTNASGEMLLYDKNTFINNLNGVIYGTQLKNGYIRIPATDERLPTLSLSATSSGGLNDGLNLLKNTPLKNIVPAAVQDWSGSGTLSSTISMNAQLGTGAISPAVVIRSQLDEGGLSSDSLNLQIGEINGQFVFDSSAGLSSDGMTGFVFGEEVSGRIRTAPYDGGVLTEMDFRGSVDIQDIYRWSEQVVLWPLSGKTSYELGFKFYQNQDKSSKSVLLVSSDLKGIKVQAPLPFEKEAAGTVALEYSMELAVDNPVITIKYGDTVDAILQLNDSGLDRGQFLLNGDVKPVLPIESKIFVDGLLGRLNVEEWIDFVDQLTVAQEALDSSNAVDGEVASQFDVLDKVGLFSLAVNELNVFDEYFYNAGATLGRGNESWSAHLNNDDVVGQFTIPDDFEVGGIVPVTADVGFLRYPWTSGGLKGKNAELPGEPTLTPGDIPPLIVEINKLELFDDDMGRWAFETKRQVDSIDIVNINARYRHTNIKGDATWKKTDQTEHTVFVGEASIENIADVLLAWDYPSSVSSKSASASVDVSWPGMPGDIDYEVIAGKMSMRMYDGVFEDVDSKTSAIRFFGILNFHTFQRRLKLDFSDLYKKGIAFDRVKGDFSLANSILTSSNIHIRAPSAEFALAGSADLKNEVIDYDLAVTLPLKSSLRPACLAGPAACGAVLVVEKVWGDKLQKLTTLRYELSGPWLDPNVKEVDEFAQ